jgi:hypothetical protein
LLNANFVFWRVTLERHGRMIYVPVPIAFWNPYWIISRSPQGTLHDLLLLLYDSVSLSRYAVAIYHRCQLSPMTAGPVPPRSKPGVTKPDGPSRLVGTTIPCARSFW